jgi:hypothetical protein
MDNIIGHLLLCKFQLAAVQQNGLALLYASEKLQSDKEVVLAAIKQNRQAIRYISKQLETDKGFMGGEVAPLIAMHLKSEHINDDDELPF